MKWTTNLAFFHHENFSSAVLELLMWKLYSLGFVIMVSSCRNCNKNLWLWKIFYWFTWWWQIRILSSSMINTEVYTLLQYENYLRKIAAENWVWIPKLALVYCSKTLIDVIIKSMRTSNQKNHPTQKLFSFSFPPPHISEIWIPQLNINSINIEWLHLNYN